tara:strand:- start:1891 stop:5349 length:3459 start_codon:yes stop_codon:yes gene_type:complete
MSNPKTLGPDGTLRDTVVFSTTVATRFFEGTVPSDAVEVQVSINGSGFSSDDTLIQWGDGTWVVPNPEYDPDGLLLLEGTNSIGVRAILPSGTVTPPTTTQVRLTTDADLGVVASVPTNISVVQENNSVTVRSEEVTGTGFQGMNFYASQFAGGGITGYTRLNVNRVTESRIVQETEQFATQKTNLPVKVDANGDPVVDPLYFRVLGQQEDENQVVLQSDFSERYEVPETARTIQMNLTLDQVRDVTVYEFKHSRQNGPTSTPATVRVSSFTNLNVDLPLYYVVTAVFFDSSRNIEYESSFSPEVVGLPELVTTAIASIPTVSRQDIVKEFITGIFRSNPQVRVEAGSVLRDTVIDPFSSESERLRFLLDFYQRARTPTLLLQVDDPTGSGTSTPVNQSSYKLGLKGALYITSDAEVQGLINSAFDAYASNFGVRRRSGTAAAGEVLFLTTSRPTSSIVIPLGTLVSGGTTSFATTREATVPFNNVASFFNPISGTYQISVPVQATTTGSQTNVGVGQIKSVTSSLSTSLRVTNLAAMSGGRDSESNLALTARVQNRLASVDSGTERGYLQTAADVPGVVRANVITAGDDLMQRDLNAAGEHKGGKVDIWVQGENVATVTDTFAFTFDVSQDVQFEVLSITDLTFRALDSTLSQSSPIVEVLNDASVGYEFRNASTGAVFDLTGVTVLTYNTIQLSTSVAQPAVDLTDVVLGSYRKQTGTTFILPRQPVTEITSVVGTVSGTLPADSYLLVRPEAPLDTGRSALASDFLQINGYTDSAGTTVPSGASIAVTDEAHVLIGQYPEFVDSLGANYLTIVVKSADGLTTYKGPNDPGGAPDYQITLGSPTAAVSITRSSASTIPNGSSVLVSYEHDENFTVTYTTNLIVSLTQDAVDANKHATADVIVKEALAAPLDIEATVVLARGRDSGTVDTALRTNLSNFFANLRLGDAVRQSDIIDVIERTRGVSYVLVPLTKMVRAQGGTVVRESLSTDTVSESILMTGLTSNDASVYLLANELTAATVDGGGAVGDFKAVFQDDAEMELLLASATLSTLGSASGLAYIIGSEGKAISGYSDDATLEAGGYSTDAAKKARRVETTANRVLVSTETGDSPTSHKYAATYVVGGDKGAKNIDPGAAEYCEEGTFTFTYDEER